MGTSTTIGFSNADEQLQAYNEMKKASTELVGIIGNLMVDKAVELVFFRHHLVDTTATEMLNHHKYAAIVVNKPISIFETNEMAKALKDLDLKPAKIDIGKLTSEWSLEENSFASRKDFLSNKLSHIIGGSVDKAEPRDVVLFGFGRIGRLVARELIAQAGKGQQLRLKAIVIRNVDEASLVKRASLFSNDSVHGNFAGTVDLDLENMALVINGQRIYFVSAPDPGKVDYTKYGIKNALLIDNTGIYKDKEQLSIHLKANGVSKVLLTAPGAEIPNVVYGINHKELDLDGTDVFCAASCTTNAISPVLKVINDHFTIEKGHIETVHAYTNDQNLLDNMHKKHRRGRSAAINMVITETGAAKAVTKVIPSLKEKLTANAVRVPTPNGSLAIMHLTLVSKTDRNTVNETMKKAALEGELVNQIYYSIDEELVSNDIIGNTCCAVFDSPATIISNDGKNIVLYVWYDNEFGYTKQVIRLAKYIAKVRRNIYY